MLTIWKYVIPKEEINDNVSIRMPEGSKPLTVRTQFGEVCVWVLVDPEKPVVKHYFRCVGTGNKIKEDLVEKAEYIGSTGVPGNYVVHFFYTGENMI